MTTDATIPSAPSLPVERFFRISLFLLLFSAILTIISTGKIDLFTSVVATIAMLYRARRWWFGHEPELSSRVATLLVLCYVLFFPVDIFFLSRTLAANSPNPPLYAALISSVHFLIFVLLVRLYSARTDRDAHFLLMLAFAAVLASAVLTVDTTFLFLFFLFLLFAVATYAGLELRRGASGALVPAAASAAHAEKKLARALTIAAVGVSIGSIVIGTILFFLLPRVSAGYLGKTSFNPTLLSGFSDQVELGQIGQIKKSDAVVLRVETGSPVNYPWLRWRGNALANFDGRRWTRSTDGSSENLEASADGWIALRARPKPGELRGEILQFTVLQEPMASDALFVTGSMLAIRGNFAGAGSGLGHRRNYVQRDTADSLTNPFHNFVAVRYTGIAQLPALDRARLEAAGSNYPVDISARYLQLPEIDPRIATLAQSATQSVATPYDKARALETFLKTKFFYTLDLTSNPGKEPLAHFLFETKAGHCEYFASSMTVMLRTLGIPAREVNGFLPGEYNELGGDYIVRASDAHSWVEAYFPGTGWVVFDPTPDAPPTKLSFYARISQLADWAELAWNDWVISYDVAHQAALAQTVQVKSRNWREVGMAWVAAKEQSIRNRLSRWQVRNGVWSFVLPVLLVALLVALHYGWLGWVLRQIQLAIAMRTKGPAAVSPQIASRMYAELLKLLGRNGYARTEAQTPFEFAALFTKPALSDSVGEFTRLYTDARYGGAKCNVVRLRELLGTIRLELRAK